MRLRVSCSAILCPLFGLLAAGGFAHAQSVISAHSGIVHYIEGDVSVDDVSIHPKFGQFPDVKNGQLLATGEGRAEVLLTPGVFLRLAENSSVRMVSNTLSDTRLEMVSGSALLEVGELLENNALAFTVQGTAIGFPKKGLYRLNAEPAALRVLEGRAVIRQAENSSGLTVKKGQEIALDSTALTATKFDVKDNDSFYRWGARRSGYIATANLTSARVAGDSSYQSGYTGTSMWSWNPYFGMFTYLPSNGVYFSPFGSAFYSPGLASELVYLPTRSRLGPAAVATPQIPISRPTAMMGSPVSGGMAGGGSMAGGGRGTSMARGPMAGRAAGAGRAH